MKILAIETSTLTGSVALLDGDTVRGEVTLSVSVQHSERLMPALDRLFTDAGCPSSAIDLFAAAIGPGSFTGLRIGIAAAQGLALSHEKPILGVSTLEALALNGLFFQGLIVPVIDAFRSEVFCGLYKAETEGLKRLGEDSVIGPKALLEDLWCRGEEILFLGSGTALIRREIQESLPETKIHFAPPPHQNPRASNVAYLAGIKWKNGINSEPVLPAYIRKPG